MNRIISIVCFGLGAFCAMMASAAEPGASTNSPVNSPAADALANRNQPAPAETNVISVPHFPRTNTNDQLEEFRRMTPEQRKARIAEIRQRRATNANATAATQSLRLEERRALIKNRLDQLRQKKANGTLSPEESKQLEQWEKQASKAPNQAARAMVGATRTNAPARPAATP